MKQKFLVPVLLVGFVLLALPTVALADVHKIPLARVPAEARNTIMRTAGTAKIIHIDRRAENGDVTFEVSINRNGVEREFTVSNEGELLSVEVGLEEVPAFARASIQRVVGTNEIERIDKSTDSDGTEFEVNFEKAGQGREFTVSADGVMKRFEITYAELPRIVRATVEKNIATNKMERVDRTFEDGELNYDVQFKTNGETRVLTVGTNGVLSRIEVGLNQTPDAVWKTIHAQLRDWKLGDIDKVFDGDELTYEVDLKKGRVTRELAIDANGKVVSEKVELSDLPAAARKTIEEKVGKGKIIRIDRNYEEDGKISFDIESKKDGKSFDFGVAEDGNFLGED